MKKLKNKHISIIIDKLDKAFEGMAIKENTEVFRNNFRIEKAFEKDGNTITLSIHHTAPAKKTVYPSIRTKVAVNGKNVMTGDYDVNAYLESFSANWLWYLIYDIINEFMEKTGVSTAVSVEMLFDNLLDDSVEM